MELLQYIFIFLLGSAIGSFLGVVVDRLHRGENIIKGRSHCDYCKKPLSVLDLVPIFSFLFLGGKCRYCGAKLSLFYPTIEIITGTLFVITFIFAQEISHFSFLISHFSIDLLFYLFIISSVIIIFFIDLRHGIIPFSVILPATLITFFYLILNTKYLILNNIYAAFGAFLFFLCLFLLTRGRGMGFGDVIYAFFMGLFLGFPKIVLGLYIAFVSGALISLILIILKKKKLKGSTVPFGPFLVVGTLIALFWGDKIITAVINILR